MSNDSSVPLSRSTTEMTEMLNPSDANAIGRALGGVVMHWMDICAGIAAMRFAGTQCVTASMDGVDFLEAIQIGEVVTVSAHVFDTGTTSIDVKVEVTAGDPRTREQRTTTSSFFTFVALDDSFNPTEVPALACPTEEEETLRDNARHERKERIRSATERTRDK